VGREANPVRRGAAALAASFAVYLSPLVGPHAAWLLGEYLFGELAHGGRGRAPAWLATDVAVAVAVQALIAFLLWWMLGLARAMRFALLLALVPVAVVAIEWLYLIAIPSYFLIDREVAPERAPLAEDCFLPDRALAPVRTPPDVPLERAGRTWFTTPNAGALGILDSCDDAPRPLADLPGSFATTPFVLADGQALFATWDAKEGRTSWWRLGAADRRPRALENPPSEPDRLHGAFPILSNDGSAIAWKEYVAGVTRTPLPERIIVRRLDGAAPDETVPLPPPGPTAVELLGVDTVERTVLLFEHDYASRAAAVVTIGFDGATRRRSAVSPRIAAQSSTIVVVGDGWVAWDAYRDAGRYRIAWSLGDRRGEVEVPLGRGITAVDVDATGSYVAVSTTTSLNIGRIRDAVYVLSTRDGEEVFRRYLPTYTRSRVAFLAAGRLAYDDKSGDTFGIRLVQLRAPAEMALTK
jgi:hypothetical protein